MSDQEVQNAYRVLERHGETLLFWGIRVEAKSCYEYVHHLNEVTTNFAQYLSIFLPEVESCLLSCRRIDLHFKHNKIFRIETLEKETPLKIWEQWKTAKLLTGGRK